MDYLKDVISKSKQAADPSQDIKPNTQTPEQSELFKKVFNQSGEKTAKSGKVVEEAQKMPISNKTAEVKEVESRGTKNLITTYGEVKIYRITGDPLPFYTIPVAKPTGPERNLINTVKEAATRLINIGSDQVRDIKKRRTLYIKRVKEIIEASPELGVPQTKIDFYADMVVREMIGYGAIDPLIHDDKLEEIMVVGSNFPVYVFHREYDMMKSNIMFTSDVDINNIVARVARDVGRRIDRQNPVLDARLPDGSRVNATIKPISLNGTTLTIRKFREDPITIIDLINYGTVDSYLAAFLWLAVDGFGVKPANILVSGGTGSGKTTTLNTISAFIPRTDRVLTIEDTAELKLPIDHVVRFEARPSGLEGTGEITMDALVKNALRMRPDRIIVGEIRHAEAFTLFTAMNTGHQGCMGTVHANSAQETITRLENPPMNVPPIMLNALDLILMQSRLHDRRKGTMRRVTELAEVIGMAGEKPQIRTLFEWDPVEDQIKEVEKASNYLADLARHTGMSREDIALEIEKRKELLEELVSKGKRDLKSIVEDFKKFEGRTNV